MGRVRSTKRMITCKSKIEIKGQGNSIIGFQETIYSKSKSNEKGRTIGHENFITQRIL